MTGFGGGYAGFADMKLAVVNCWTNACHSHFQTIHKSIRSVVWLADWCEHGRPRGMAGAPTPVSLIAHDHGSGQPLVQKTVDQNFRSSKWTTGSTDFRMARTGPYPWCCS